MLLRAPELCSLVLAVRNAIETADGFNLSRPRSAEYQVVIKTRFLITVSVRSTISLNPEDGNSHESVRCSMCIGHDLLLVHEALQVPIPSRTKTTMLTRSRTDERLYVHGPWCSLFSSSEFLVFVESRTGVVRGPIQAGLQLLI